MALRTKTIEYAFPSNTASVAGTPVRYDFAAITLYIPETTSRTFRAFRVKVFARDTATATTSWTAGLVGLKLGSVAFSDAAFNTPVANSGESQSKCWERDFTAYANTNFGSGASQTCQVGISITGPATINHTAKLFITYEYDDADQTTLAKTIRIPLDSKTGALTATLAEIGTNQIPAIDTYLPESSKVYRSIWIEAIYNESTIGAVNDASLGMQIDTGTEHLTGIHESALGSACFGWYIWNQGASPVWSTGSAHAFKARSSNITTASTFEHVGWLLCVTYEYAASSETVINEQVIPIIPHNYSPGNSSASRQATIQDVWVEEPGTITMRQSGVLLLYSTAGSYGLRVKIGAGSYVSYDEIGGTFCGGSALTHRFDSGGAGGAALTLARGKNTFQIETYVNRTTWGAGGISGFLILNYTSSVHASGEGAHAHSTLWSVLNSGAQYYEDTASATQWVNIPESAYFVGGLGWCLVTDGNNVTTGQHQILFQTSAGEMTAGAFVAARFSSLDWWDSETGINHVFIATPHDPHLFNRWTNDPRVGGLDIEGSRVLRVTGGSVMRSLACWLTYHSITFAASGTLSGGWSGTVNICLHDSTTHECLAKTTRSGAGAYSLTWFDNTRNCYVEATDGTNVGRSGEQTLS